MVYFTTISGHGISISALLHPATASLKHTRLAWSCALVREVYQLE